MGLLSILQEDIIPVRYMNVLYVPAAALGGGLAFAHTGSWLFAIGADIFYYVFLWIATGIGILVSRLACQLLGISNPPIQY